MKVALLVSVIPASFLVFVLLVFLYNRVQQRYMLASVVFRRSNSAWSSCRFICEQKQISLLLFFF
jgi:hypothetical protein